MKKIKRLVLHERTQQLTSNQMQTLRGGDHMVCRTFSNREVCTADIPCDNYGISGVCRWIGGDYYWASCKCETIEIGPIGSEVI